MLSLPRSKTGRLLALLGAAALVLAGCSSGDDSSNAERSETTGAPSTTTTTASAQRAAGVTDLVLDPDHDYGNRYADGVLPVGDGKYVLDTPVVGSIFLCRAPQTGAPGAQTRGPWFNADGTEYDINEKVAVTGEVEWDGTYDVTVRDGQRVVTTNDLPHDHTTGVFPIAPSDPAYQYDRNPNSIAAQAFTYTLDADPAVNSSPSCMGGEVGVMTTGVALFDGFDAGGRDAGAWEVQDGCNGHPQMTSVYHYHTLSSCIADVSVSTVIGFALDGFPITGPMLAPGNVLTTADLDECHGITSTVTLDGEQVTTYHYVMTQDFPYSASCFRGTPTTPPGR